MTDTKEELEVVAWRIGFPNGAGYKVYENPQPWAHEQYGVPAVTLYEVQELCRISDANTMIDQIKAENERLKCIIQSKHAELYEEQQRRFEGNRLTSAEHHEELQELNREHTHKIVALTIQVEKLLCEKLGREWSASGISIETLTNDLASERDTLRTQLAEARELLGKSKDYIPYGWLLYSKIDAWLEACSTQR